MTAAVPFLIPAVFLAAFGNLLLRQGMRSLDVGSRPASLGSTALHALRSPAVWSGTTSYAAAMACWLQVLSRAEIGLVSPVFSGGATVVVMVASVLWLGERIEARRAIGAVLMIAGIFIASME